MQILGSSLTYFLAIYEKVRRLLYPNRTTMHFLQYSCRSGKYQILPARLLHFKQTYQILADQTVLTHSDVSCKIVAG